MTRHLLIGGLIVAAVALAYCSDNKTPVTPIGPTPAAPALRITGNTQGLDVNQTSQLAAVASSTDGTSRDVSAEATWRSSNPAVATVSARGLLTVVGLGRTGVSALYQGRLSTADVLVLPSGTYILRGTVTEPGPVPIGEARVDVIDGSHAGRSATTNGLNGTYEIYGLSGTLSVRVTKDGFVVDTKSVSLTENRVLDFELRPTAAPLPIAGNYRLTIAASNSCASRLPEDGRTRTYDARINQGEAKLLVNVEGAPFVLHPRTGTGNHFFGTIRANAVSLTIDSDFYNYGATFFDLVEQLGPTTYLTISGTANGTATPRTIAGSLNGAFLVWESNEFYGFSRRAVAGCYATDHQFSFVR